jgi:hypothetical protein
LADTLANTQADSIASMARGPAINRRTPAIGMIRHMRYHVDHTAFGSEVLYIKAIIAGQRAAGDGPFDANVILRLARGADNGGQHFKFVKPSHLFIQRISQKILQNQDWLREERFNESYRSIFFGDVFELCVCEFVWPGDGSPMGIRLYGR